MKTLNIITLAVAASLTSPFSMAANSEIAVIVKSSNSNYWQNVQKGAQAAAKDLPNATVTFQGPASESAIADEVNMVVNAVNRGVSGIVLAASDPDALVPAIKQAWEAHIPVVLIDSTVSAEGAAYYQSFLSTDNTKAGELCAQRMIEKVGKTGKIAIMSYVPGAGSEIGRVGGFTHYIKQHSNLTIVGPFYSQSQMANALNQTTDVLSANPDLKGIYGANEPTAVGMARGIAQAGKAGKLVAIGFDGNEDLQNFVKDGTLDSIVVQSSYKMGLDSVTSVAKVIARTQVPKTIDTGVLLIDKSNIDSTEAKNVLY
ncbi:ABC transporter substrate-binding protein [Pseudomonas abietaniphila]|uniref:Monosaccharide ABC transporter substrate-binding protein, CUT2 family n=1 Tax=Pseudomonas abietaniphila TaxID=89065 RepID=A0A1G8EG10_9PSED|nr:ABC transporter substrate-binding protein [Pseudomonas abietaniphila]SDH68827.1 monosaccharide ABC transporter substrate-binding protein, CUT2 family [Pseudomonas abietaniphila]